MAINESIDWASRETSEVVGVAIYRQAEENCSNSETEIEIIREALRIWQEPTTAEISRIYDKIIDWDRGWCWGQGGEEWAWDECLRRVRK